MPDFDPTEIDALVDAVIEKLRDLSGEPDLERRPAIGSRLEQLSELPLLVTPRPDRIGSGVRAARRRSTDPGLFRPNDPLPPQLLGRHVLERL